MSKTVTVDKMSAEMSAILNTYDVEYRDKVKEIVGDLAKKGVKMTKEKAKHYHWDDYGEHFAVRWENDQKGKYVAHVQEKERYQLTHLLEHGHAKRGGGKTRAFPHIAPVQDELNRLLEEEIKKI
ncbi:HK97 gp10 family phage protein [Candidatus Saccharibacteria bacterium]|nr:HK97 gp10 family phage protein [Candidatus Saccharibacteria bacterium]MBR4614580.1 HK97 gp10 family phage protein [Kiritimatiellia bacterium]